MKSHPSLSQVHLLEEADRTAEAMTSLLKEDFITLVVFKRSLEEFDEFLESASLACTQVGSVGKERVILLEEEAEIALLKEMPLPPDPVLTTPEEPALTPSPDPALTTPEAVPKTFGQELLDLFNAQSPTQTVPDFDALLAFSVFPDTGKIGYVISNEGANFIEVDIAFGEVISNLTD